MAVEVRCVLEGIPVIPGRNLIKTDIQNEVLLHVLDNMSVSVCHSTFMSMAEIQCSDNGFGYI